MTSKLPGRHHNYKEAILTIEESVLRTGLDYIDLYLIHWPNPIQDKYVEAWNALIDAQKFGLIRSIGVSNFLPEHIERLEKETGILPVINQIEMHPNFNQKDQIAFDASKNIITEAWSPLGRASEILNHPIIGGIADRYNKTIPQVILRWQIQQGVVPIPKASNIIRQKNNLDVFSFYLTDEDMGIINQLTKVEGRLQNQDPAKYEEF